MLQFFLFGLDFIDVFDVWEEREVTLSELHTRNVFLDFEEFLFDLGFGGFQLGFE